MKNKKIFFVLFLLIAIAQILVPAKMIYDRENILKTGKEFKFITAPVDPNDPFRGKYIYLSFVENSFPVQNRNEWSGYDEIFVLLTNDENGFTKILSVSKEEPENHIDYVKSKINYISNDSVNSISINYPFDRFYMEENLADDAEKVHRESMIDSTKVTYALVSIKEGETVLKDVLIDGISIKEIVKSRIVH